MDTCSKLLDIACSGLFAPPFPERFPVRRGWRPDRL
jgi:hypothetical protein